MKGLHCAYTLVHGVVKLYTTYFYVNNSLYKMGFWYQSNKKNLFINDGGA